MSDEAAQFVGSIPEHYDRGLGPVFFAGWGADLAARAAALRPVRVLELAAGTGIVTRLLRDALPAVAELVATDLNAPMLEIAKQKMRDGEKVVFQTADATSLPFPDRSFDAVVCQFGVMFFPDKDRAYREARRVLAPGGHYLFNVWDSFDRNPAARLAHTTIAGFFPADPPGFYLVPYSYHRIDPIKDALEAAGFDDIAFRVLRMHKDLPDPAAFARGLVFGNPVIDEIGRRGGVAPDQVFAAVRAALGRELGEKPCRVPMQIIVVSARKP